MLSLVVIPQVLCQEKPLMAANQVASQLEQGLAILPSVPSTKNIGSDERAADNAPVSLRCK